MEALYKDIVNQLRNVHLKGYDSFYASKQKTHGLSPLKKSWITAIASLTGVKCEPTTISGEFYIVYRGDDNLVNLIGSLEIKSEKFIMKRVKEESLKSGNKDRFKSVALKTQLYNELNSMLMLSNMDRFKKRKISTI